MKLLKIPFGGGGLGKGNGSREGPRAILEELGAQAETIPVDEYNIEETHKNIATRIATQKEPALILGGDHSITYATIKGFKKNHEDFKLIIFDAHPDLMEEPSNPSHEAYLRTLIDEHIVKPENILVLGIRNSDEQEEKYAEEQGITLITMKEITKRGREETTKTIQNFCEGTLYLSIDIDVLDPRIAPGTGYQEPGGMSKEELLEYLEPITPAMIDLVEVNPGKDSNHKTSKLAANIIEYLVTKQS